MRIVEFKRFNYEIVGCRLVKFNYVVAIELRRELMKKEQVGGFRDIFY